MWFETDGDTQTPLDKKIGHSQAEYDRACDEIQMLKCGANVTSEYVLPTLENVLSTSNLPRIEQICQNAKQAYYRALNRNRPANNFDNVLSVYCTSNVYIEALRQRGKLLIRLKSARERKKRASQSLADLLKLKAEQPTQADK